MVGRNILSNPLSKAHNFLSPTRKTLNLLDPVSINLFLQKNKIEFVIHSAGIVGGIEANIQSPVRYLVENSQMGMNLVNACASHGITNFMNLGSSCMYPAYFPQPLSEQDLLQGLLEPTNEGYALAKILVTKLCEFVSNQNKYLSYKTVIPCNLYGPHDNFSYNSSHMIPAVIRKIHNAITQKENNIQIWGDGQARREFMNVKDFSNFIFYAIENFQTMPQNLNVGLGYDYSINNYYEIIAEQLGFLGKFSHDLSKPVGMHQKLLNIEKLKTFGWSHKVSLEDGIQDAYKFFKEKYVN